MLAHLWRDVTDWHREVRVADLTLKVRRVLHKSIQHDLAVTVGNARGHTGTSSLSLSSPPHAPRDEDHDQQNYTSNHTCTGSLILSFHRMEKKRKKKSLNHWRVQRCQQKLQTPNSPTMPQEGTKMTPQEGTKTSPKTVNPKLTNNATEGYKNIYNDCKPKTH